jgi:outer membrane lipoprotein-sorting protein
MAKQIQTMLAVLLLVVIATLTASVAVAEAAATKMKEYYASYKKRQE